MSIGKIASGAFLAIAMTLGASAAMQAQGQCKLTNLKVNKVLYQGACDVRQSKSGENTIYEIKLGSAQSFLFAGHGDSWMHGPQKVKFTNHGKGGIFVWDKFALSVAVD